jgi:ferredoxin, 2Fe-2S
LGDDKVAPDLCEFETKMNLPGMIAVRFLSSNGTSTQLMVPATGSLMEAAVRNGVDGIVAQCAGACACATCHVFVDDNWMAALLTPDPIETDMLEFVTDRRPQSRLSCQIRLSKALDGLIVTLPDSQL